MPSVNPASTLVPSLGENRAIEINVLLPSSNASGNAHVRRVRSIRPP